jgi:hypothetical protein
MSMRQCHCTKRIAIPAKRHAGVIAALRTRDK